METPRSKKKRLTLERVKKHNSRKDPDALQEYNNKRAKAMKKLRASRTAAKEAGNVKHWKSNFMIRLTIYARTFSTKVVLYDFGSLV